LATAVATVGDVANLAGEIRGHGVHVVGEIFPCAATPGTIGLAAELAFGADFTGHATDFAGEAIELIHHRVDRVLQLQNFAFTSTVIFFDKSPFATAVVTSAMLRTCEVRFVAIAFTESVRSFQVPATPRTSA
jgi:hypothetical protein